MFYAKDNKTENKIQEVSKLHKLIKNTTSRKVSKVVKGAVFTTTNITSSISLVTGVTTKLVTNTIAEVFNDNDLYKA
jgi:ABC-type taurine transport system substrate-binding protein